VSGRACSGPIRIGSLGIGALCTVPRSVDVRRAGPVRSTAMHRSDALAMAMSISIAIAMDPMMGSGRGVEA